MPRITSPNCVGRTVLSVQGVEGRGGWPASRGRLISSAGVEHQASVTAGTIFQDTHKPLRLWFRAIWHVTSQKNGASAVSLQQVLGLGGYLTAWTWLHKLRRAMIRPGRDRALVAAWKWTKLTLAERERAPTTMDGTSDPRHWWPLRPKKMDGGSEGSGWHAFPEPARVALQAFVKDSVEPAAPCIRMG